MRLTKIVCLLLTHCVWRQHDWPTSGRNLNRTFIDEPDLHLSRSDTTAYCFSARPERCDDRGCCSYVDIVGGFGCDCLVHWPGNRCRRRYRYHHRNVWISEFNSDGHGESDRRFGHAVPDKPQLHIDRGYHHPRRYSDGRGRNRDLRCNRNLGCIRCINRDCFFRWPSDRCG